MLCRGSDARPHDRHVTSCPGHSVCIASFNLQHCRVMSPTVIERCPVGMWFCQTVLLHAAHWQEPSYVLEPTLVGRSSEEAQWRSCARSWSIQGKQSLDGFKTVLAGSRPKPISAWPSWSSASSRSHLSFNSVKHLNLYVVYINVLNLYFSSCWQRFGDFCGTPSFTLAAKKDVSLLSTSDAEERSPMNFSAGLWVFF